MDRGPAEAPPQATQQVTPTSQPREIAIRTGLADTLTPRQALHLTARDSRMSRALPDRAVQAQAALRLRLTSWRIIGVKMTCMASGILPPGTTMLLGRDMNEPWSMLSR